MTPNSRFLHFIFVKKSILLTSQIIYTCNNSRRHCSQDFFPHEPIKYFSAKSDDKISFRKVSPQRYKVTNLDTRDVISGLCRLEFNVLIKLIFRSFTRLSRFQQFIYGSCQCLSSVFFEEIYIKPFKKIMRSYFGKSEIFFMFNLQH